MRACAIRCVVAIDWQEYLTPIDKFFVRNHLPVLRLQQVALPFPRKVLGSGFRVYGSR